MIKYKAHINVEICPSVNNVKYFNKYIYKDYDCANGQIERVNEQDEIKEFLNTPYVSAPEAIWRIFVFKNAF